jgi:hypothetical protein
MHQEKTDDKAYLETEDIDKYKVNVLYPFFGFSYLNHVRHLLSQPLMK